MERSNIRFFPLLPRITSVGILWGVLFILLLQNSSTPSQPPQRLIRRGGTVWVDLSAGKVFRLQGYKVWETFNTSSHVRKDFIKRATDLHPIHFYTHERGIEVTLGHESNLVLINDYFASEACKVVVVNLQSGRARRIDERVVKTYYRHFVKDKRIFMDPQAYGFSPDDKKVLIGMVLDSTMGHSPEEASYLSKITKKAWYVVDGSNGAVLREYPSNNPPEGWWQD